MEWGEIEKEAAFLKEQAEKVQDAKAELRRVKSDLIESEYRLKKGLIEAELVDFLSVNYQKLYRYFRNKTDGNKIKVKK